MSTVQCTVNTENYTMYSAQCIVHNVYCRINLTDIGIYV